jgi:hypothetical protein
METNELHRKGIENVLGSRAGINPLDSDRDFKKLKHSRYKFTSSVSTFLLDTHVTLSWCYVFSITAAR